MVISAFYLNDILSSFALGLKYLSLQIMGQNKKKRLKKSSILLLDAGMMIIVRYMTVISSGRSVWLMS